MRTSGPVILGSDHEELVGVRSDNIRQPRNLKEFDPPSEVSGLVLSRIGRDRHGRLFKGIPDDNRSTILPNVVSNIGGRGYALSAKGVGARTPLYGESPLDFTFRSDFGMRSSDSSDGVLTGPRLLTSELWFGEAPYGAQGDVPATQGLMVTELAKGCSIEGFHICPVIEVMEFPPVLLDGMEDVYWYRRHSGPVLQEHRLMPSNIRLFHQSETTLGQNTDAVLQAFGVDTPESLDAFLDAYVSSGVSALTLFVRTLRPCQWGFQGLDYAHVWLDKDCVVAPDGTLHFVDLEGLDWILAGQDWTVEERVRDQFDRNFYEFMYGLDLLFRNIERLQEHKLSQEKRRERLATRFSLALAGDSFVRCESSRDALDLVVRPRIGGEKDIVIRAIDLR